MIRVNKKHSVQYKNGYFLLREHGVIAEGKNKGAETVKQDKTYPDIGSMVLQSDFEMGYEYTDAILKSKANYHAKESATYLAAKLKKEDK